MPVVVNATPGDPNANSYVTLAEANAYHDTVLLAHGEFWNDADIDDRNRALVTATRLLDEHLRWIGWPASYAQTLGWPRIRAYTRTGALLDAGTIPTEIKFATADLARRLLAEGMPDAPSDTEGIRRLKAGPIDIEFNEPSETVTIPPMVEAMILHLTARTSSSSSAPVVRT